MHTDPGSFHRTDQGIIAHSARKRNVIPATEYSVAYHVLGLVPCALKVFGLVAHVTWASSMR